MCLLYPFSLANKMRQALLGFALLACAGAVSAQVNLIAQLPPSYAPLCTIQRADGSFAPSQSETFCKCSCNTSAIDAQCEQTLPFASPASTAIKTFIGPSTGWRHTIAELAMR